jgi:hypothetical protein
MDFRYLFGTTPAVKSASLWLKLFKCLEGAQIKIAHSTSELDVKSYVIIFDCELFEDIFVHIQTIILNINFLLIKKMYFEK